MCPNCGRAFPPNAIWMVNPERYFCTCPKYPLTPIPAASRLTQVKVNINLAILDALEKVEATRPSDV